MSAASHHADIGDIVRTHWPIELDKSVNLYLGNGRCGGCFDAWGLQHQPSDGVAKRVSNTWLAHAEVFHHGRYGIDVQTPLGRLAWSVPPATPTSYRQQLRLADGSLTTDFQNDAIAYHIRTWTDPYQRDALFIELRWRTHDVSAMPVLTLRPVPEFTAGYVAALTACAERVDVTGGAGLRVRMGTAEGVVLARAAGDAAWVADIDGLALRPSTPVGCVRLTLVLGPASRLDALTAALALEGDRAAESWLRRWGAAAPRIADADMAKLWWRSVYHLLATYGPDVRCPAPPMGYTGNAWGFHFPQDLSYIHPVFLRLGHLDIARAIVEFYHSRIPQQTRMTRRLYDKPGVLWAWEFPIGESDDMLAEGSPNHFQFETHNAAYPARMAYETAMAMNDPEWSKTVAWPVVRESARFLGACLAKGDDGLWGIHVIPSMGQDEYGGEDAPDYLCALFAADYTLKAALDLARRVGENTPEADGWRRVLADGLAYPRLLLPEGFYRTNAAASFVPHRQKHPVQLNPLTFLPLGRIDEPTRRAWRMRHRICSIQREGMHHPGVPGCFYDGWTLFAFILAAARIGDTDGLAHEWRQAIPSQHVDPDLITIYESSGYWSAYYTTSMGLFVQAVLAAADESPAGEYSLNHVL